MGGFSDLERRARDAERRVIEGQESVLAHARGLGQAFRWRYLAGTIIIAGLATGIAAHQYIRIRAVAAARRKLRPRSTPKPSKGLQKRALSLIPIAQVVYTQLKKRLAAPPPRPTPQSTRSISRADHSSTRAGNGLLRQ